MTVYAKCIKDTYTYNGEQHKFSGCVKDHLYAFNFIDGTYWIDQTESPDRQDFLTKNGFYVADARGLSENLFSEMFTIVIKSEN